VNALTLEQLPLAAVVIRPEVAVSLPEKRLVSCFRREQSGPSGEVVCANGTSQTYATDQAMSALDRSADFRMSTNLNAGVL
jgi:hypothetical protein